MGALESSRRAARQTIESQYTGVCRVVEYGKIRDEVSKITHHGEVTVLENQPCKLSFERTYPAEKTDNDSFGNEGEGAHTQFPYDWQAGRWYRMLLQCGTSETTGNTTVEQWFQDLTIGEWTHTVTYDTGVKDSAFLGNAAIFSENFLKQYAGGVRSLEVANVRIHTTSDNQWLDVTSISSIRSRVDTTGVLANIYGSWEAGADANSFYMISTGVSGWGRRENTGKLTVENRESGDPLEGNPLK